MNNTVDPNKLKKAPFASSCFILFHFHTFPHKSHYVQYTLLAQTVSNYVDLFSAFLYYSLFFQILKFSRHRTAIDT